MALKFYCYATGSGTKYAVQMDDSLMQLLHDANGGNLTDGHGSSPPTAYASLVALQVDEPGAVMMPGATLFTPRMVTFNLANFGSISIVNIDPTVHATFEPTAPSTPLDTGHGSSAHLMVTKWQEEAYLA